MTSALYRPRLMIRELTNPLIFSGFRFKISYSKARGTYTNANARDRVHCVIMSALKFDCWGVHYMRTLGRYECRLMLNMVPWPQQTRTNSSTSLSRNLVLGYNVGPFLRIGQWESRFCLTHLLSEWHLRTTEAHAYLRRFAAGSSDNKRKLSQWRTFSCILPRSFSFCLTQGQHSLQSCLWI
jgi:hypothetical protein